MGSQLLSHTSVFVEPSCVKAGNSALMVSQGFGGVGAAEGRGPCSDVGEGACYVGCCGRV
jgi:hypothetical protein